MMRGLPGEGRVPASPAAEAVSSRTRGEEEPVEDAHASTGEEEEEETVLRSMGVRDSGMLGEGVFKPDASSLPGARGAMAIRAAVM
jgi:hypothetical protein